MRKLICTLLALCMVLGMNIIPAVAEEPIKLTVAIPDKVNVEDYNTNVMTLQLEEELGVDLEFIVYPSTDYETKLNLMIASGEELPDILMGGNNNFKAATIYSWALQGALTPVTQYYADPEISKNIHDTYETLLGDWSSMVTMPDGEIYQIPAYFQSVGNEQGAKLWIDMTVLEGLGLSIPTTTEELANVLRAVKAANPDMIGIAGYEGLYDSYWFDYLMNSFVYSDSAHDFMAVEDGKLFFSYTTEAWKEGIKYIKSLIDEGLIAKESLTQDRDQWVNMINSVPTFGLCYIAASDINEGKDNFESIEPMTGPEGVKYARYNPTVPSGGMLITADCEYPELAFKVGDLMTRIDYTITNRWGQRGQDWDWFEDYAASLGDDYDESKWSATVPGCDRLIIIYDDATFWGSGNMQNRAYMNMGPAVRDYTVAGGRTINADTVSAYTLHLAESYQQYPPFYPEECVSLLMYTEEENEIITEILANLQTYVSLTCSNWLLSNGDIDAEWDAFQAELKKIGIDQALEIAQAAYTRSQSK